MGKRITKNKPKKVIADVAYWNKIWKDGRRTAGSRLYAEKKCKQIAKKHHITYRDVMKYNDRQKVLQAKRRKKQHEERRKEMKRRGWI